MAYDVSQLLKMSQTQLDELFTKSTPGEIPDGEGKGTAIVAPGTTYSKEIAELSYQWTRPYVLSSARTQEVLGMAPTPWDEVCRRTALGGTVEVRPAVQ